MMSRLGFAALATLLVLGCANPLPAERQWTRQGATPEDVKSDLFWCTTEVAIPSRAQDTPAASGRARSELRVDGECMENRGYKRVSPKG